MPTGIVRRGLGLSSRTGQSSQYQPLHLSFRGTTRPSFHKDGRLRVYASQGAIIGIDLGTSNSAVAVIQDGSPVIIKAEAERATVPSVITLGKDEDDAKIGVSAQLAAPQDPLNCFYSIKRLIGRSYANCYREAGSLVYTLAEGDAGETLLWSPARERRYSPEEVSGMILKHLIGCAERHLGTEIEGAVIAVPAHFDNAQRQATLRAAQSAGLKKVQLLQEPVAAAMAYGLQLGGEEEGILVFDLGGGTYDVSLLEGFEGIFEVLATGGDSRLGGDDWDRAIADWCLQKCRADLRMAIRGQPKLLHQLLHSSRLAKVQLSSQMETEVHMPSSNQPRGNQGPVLKISRQDLESITQRLRSRLGPPLERLGKECFVEWVGEETKAMIDVNITAEAMLCRFPNSLPGGRSQHMSVPGKDKFKPKPRKISQVVLVGAATRIPSVRQFIMQLTGIEPCSWVNPEECVALGAAIQAGILVGDLKGMELSDGSFSKELHGSTTGFQSLSVAS